LPGQRLLDLLDRVLLDDVGFDELLDVDERDGVRVGRQELVRIGGAGDGCAAEWIRPLMERIET